MSEAINPQDRFEIDRPPDPHPWPPRRFTLPHGAVDAHAYVIGDAYVEERSYTPCPAPGEAYLRMLDAVGFRYGLLVQVSVHGTDNSLMVRVLEANRQRLRGIAVLRHDAGDVTLAALRAQASSGCG